MSMTNLGKFIVLKVFFGLFLGFISQAFGQASYDLLARDIAVFPIAESKQAKLGKKIQQIIIDVLSDEYSEYNVISEDKIDRFLSENAVSPGEAIGPVILEKALMDLPCNTVIFGNIINMEKIKKVLVKILISKKLYEYYNFTFDLAKEYTIESLSETIRDNLKEAFNSLPYSGFVSNIGEKSIEIKIRKRDTIQVGRVLRVVRITSIEEHPLLKKITNVAKEEIAAVKVAMIGAESIKCDIVKVKDGNRLEKNDLIDMEDSTLYKPIEPKSLEDKTVDDAFDAEVGDETKEDEFLESTTEKKTQIIEEKIPEESVKIRAEEPKIELLIGLIGGVSLEKNNLTSSVATTITNGNKTIYTFGNGGVFVDFWPIKYLGIYAQYEKAFLPGYSVSISYEGQEAQAYSVSFFTDEAYGVLKGRLPLSKSEKFPWIALRLGYEYKNVSVDSIISTDGELLFMPQTKYYSPLAGIEFKIPFIPSFGMRGFFDYWFLGKAKEDPVNSTGTDPILFSFTGGGGFFLSPLRHFEFCLDYNIDYHKTSYLGASKRYAQDITDGNILDLFHKILFSVAYRF